MATYYLDYENGNDANDGLSFANRWKTMTTGATAARIAPGDTIRIMGSPDPTSLGIGATWTGEKATRISLTITGATNATPIVCTLASHGLTTGDTISITGIFSGNTAANGTWEVNVLSSSTFELIGSAGNGTWTSGGKLIKITNRVVRLNSALTQNIASTGPGPSGGLRSFWNPNTNVSAAQNTSNAREHNFSDQITIGSAFATGIAAHYTLPTTLDLSGYQQVSFCIYQSGGTIGAAGACSLVLCSDTAGAVAVNTINIPLLGASFLWHPVTVDTGGALGSSIQSIAFRVNTDNGAQTFLLNNIIACKAASSPDSLTLTSLIGKGTTEETWYAIQNINGTRVILDSGNSSTFSPLSTDYPGYFPMTGIGITENVTTHKRETIKTGYAPLSTTQVQTITDSGTVGNLIRYEGGWDRTNMSTQNLETWFDGLNGNGWGIYDISCSYVSLNKISAVRYNTNFYFTGTIDGMEIPYISAANNSSTAGVFFNLVSPNIGIQTSIGIGTVRAVSNSNHGLHFGTSSKINIDNAIIFNSSGTQSSFGFGLYVNISHLNSINNLKIYNTGNPTSCVQIASSCRNIINNADVSNNSTPLLISNGAFNNKIGILTVANNGSYGISFDSGANNNYINGGISYGSTISGIFHGTGNGGNFNYFKNFTINESIEFSSVSRANGTNMRLYSHNHDNTPGNHVIFTDNGKISSETTIRNTASGLAWKLQPTSTSRDQYYPLDFSLAKIAVNANSLVSVSCWMRRDNTGLTMQLVVPGSSTIGGSTLAGIPNAGVISSMTAAADTWEQVSLTFTPTEQGVVEIFAYAYGGSTYTGYVDDLTITQA
jgi:hypothetical protein